MNTGRSAAPAAGPAEHPVRLLPEAGGRFAVQGALTFVSARAALAQGRQLLGETGRELEVDCAGVTECDSAGLAVLLEWLGAVRRAGGTLRYRQLPRGLVALARISEVEPLLAGGG